MEPALRWRGGKLRIAGLNVSYALTTGQCRGAWPKARKLDKPPSLNERDKGRTFGYEDEPLFQLTRYVWRDLIAGASD